MWDVFNRLRMREIKAHTSEMMSELLFMLLACFHIFSQFFL